MQFVTPVADEFPTDLGQLGAAVTSPEEPTAPARRRPAHSSHGVTVSAPLRHGKAPGARIGVGLRPTFRCTWAPPSPDRYVAPSLRATPAGG